MPPCLDQEREVRLHGNRAGTIRRLSLHELAFAYAPGYREDPGAPPLSTCLPRSMSAASIRRATAWFTGLLPEGRRREQLARIVGTTSIDLWTLLDAAGAECAGAVQIVNPAYEDVPSLLRLEARELAALLHTTPVEPIGTVDRSARISLAGAQDKVALARTASGAWAVPLAGAVSTHILKPRSASYPGLVENEHWCMTIARSAVLDAARTEIITVGETPVLVVERYDRERTPGGTPVRVHQEDTAQALAAPHKYEADGGPTLDQDRTSERDRHGRPDRPNGVQLDGGQCRRTREEPLGAGAGHEACTTRARLRRALHGDVPRGAHRTRDHARRREAARRCDGVEHREGGANHRSGSGRHARAHGKARRASRRGGTLRETGALWAQDHGTRSGAQQGNAGESVA